MASVAMAPCCVLSAAGRKIEVPNAVFMAFEEMMVKYGATGSITIELKQGSVAGVKLEKRIK